MVCFIIEINILCEIGLNTHEFCQVCKLMFTTVFMNTFGTTHKWKTLLTLRVHEIVSKERTMNISLESGYFNNRFAESERQYMKRSRSSIYCHCSLCCCQGQQTPKTLTHILLLYEYIWKTNHVVITCSLASTKLYS